MRHDGEPKGWLLQRVPFTGSKAARVGELMMTQGKVVRTHRPNIVHRELKRPAVKNGLLLVPPKQEVGIRTKRILGKKGFTFSIPLVYSRKEDIIN